jgi:hypothetical protein
LLSAGACAKAALPATDNNNMDMYFKCFMSILIGQILYTAYTKALKSL